MRFARKSVSETELKRFEEFAAKMKQDIGKGPSLTDADAAATASDGVADEDLYG
jgi:hypothetical protein